MKLKILCIMLILLAYSNSLLFQLFSTPFRMFDSTTKMLLGAPHQYPTIHTLNKPPAPTPPTPPPQPSPPPAPTTAPKSTPPPTLIPNKNDADMNQVKGDRNSIM